MTVSTQATLERESEKNKSTKNTKSMDIVDLRKKCLKGRFQQKIKLDNSIQELIKRFFDDDINSRICAGKKEYVKKYGIQKQKLYLLDSVKSLRKKFLHENPKKNISYVTFSRLRPFWIYLPRDDRETCACTAHTNMDLMILALKKTKLLTSRIPRKCCILFVATSTTLNAFQESVKIVKTDK